ncbi:sensor histidine kinase [Planococcus lenghuensis]|uniref:histidine kinase n=1 Tax=Planococcus lenghuensis TaxID=2213202 RepID=A0A1Q2L1Y8_9BACL|nr:HAMP domain-containing sensor histidine kinase [Planococcus lenghuensis]AQQ54441.1 two-component sensor histidine kinase [Planococcus lenghuensis]
MRIKYSVQLIIGFLIVLLSAFLVLSLLFTRFVEELAFDEKAEELTMYGERILQDLEREQPAPYLQSYVAILEARNINFIVFDQQSRVLYPLSGDFPAVALTDAEWNVIEDGETLVVNRDFERFENTVTFVAMPYTENGRLVGGVLLAAPITGTSEMISELNRRLITTMLLALVAALVLSMILSRWHVTRIKRLRKATSLVADGQYNVSVPASNFDEIGDLAQDFGHMAKRLQMSHDEIEQLENRRRQFMADVSHEMRTPLTTIAGVMEGLQSGVIDGEQREKGIQLVSGETKRLIRLVNETLDYEKIRSNQVTLIKEQIEADELLEIIQEQLEGQAAAKGTRISVETEPGAIIYGDMDRLIQVLTNIVKNAIQFTENGDIRLSARMEAGESVMEVEDTGTGIDAAEIDSIWRRYYKVDASRGSRQFGLGLSIVKKLVTLHGGTIHVESKKGKGTRFEIRLPNDEN